MNSISRIYHGASYASGGFGTGAATGALYPQGLSVLTWGANVSVNLSLGNIFFLQLQSGSVQLDNPTNGVPDMPFVFRLRQPNTFDGLVTFDTAYRFGIDLPVPVLTAVANAVDYLMFIYNSNESVFDYVGECQGF